MSLNTRPSPRNIADFQLDREADGTFNILPTWYFDYLQPYLGATTVDDWNMFTICKECKARDDASDDSEEDSNDSDDPHVQLLNYATFLPEKTYQVLNAKLVNPDGRRVTEMRLHEMIRSTWALESDVELTRLAIRQIENANARTAILHEYERAASNAIKNEFLSAISQGANPAGLTLTISGAGALSPYWNDNPFIRTAVGVSGDAAKMTVHLIREDTTIMPRMYMVMELDGPREGQAGPEIQKEQPQLPQAE
ncbi:hypothetical protein N0V82_001613 [Gnomoniopsis sp. IMI 355080]|nr:hypothetical protein N0V82_001613 [Gnomoniopsis sp. IMI 355080]